MEENQNLDQQLAEEEVMQEDSKVEETISNEEAPEVEETITPEVEVIEEASEEASHQAEDKAAEYLDRWQRLMAEFDNYRKRSEKEKSDTYDYAVSNTVAELLPVIDNFERALKVESQDKNLFAGVEMIYKQMMGLLEKLHVSPIDAVGKEFDPNLHNAVMHIEDENLGENMVAEELQKGYLYKEKVIRHSLVKVAN